MRENRTDLYFLFITHSPMSYIYIHQHFVAAICLYSKLFPRRLHRIGTVISRNRIPELNFRLVHPYSLSLWISLFSLLALFPFNKDKKREREREEDYIEERDRESILYNRRAYSRIYRDEEGEWNAWRRPYSCLLLLLPAVITAILFQEERCSAVCWLRFLFCRARMNA